MNRQQEKWLIELGIVVFAIIIISIFVAGGLVGAFLW